MTVNLDWRVLVLAAVTIILVLAYGALLVAYLVAKKERNKLAAENAQLKADLDGWRDEVMRWASYVANRKLSDAEALGKMRQEIANDETICLPDPRSRKR